MNTNNLNTALYEKMATEQEKYRDWLKSQPPEEILHHTYEYTVREDIVMAMEELELTDAQTQALLESSSPLADVYRYFEKLETGHMDVIRDSIENRADDVCRAKEELRTTPVYPHSAAYASEHGEMAQYNLSYQANSACKEAIEQTISAHYAENRLDTEAAVKDVLEKFGTERVQYHIHLHCYVVVEVKVTEFESSYAGQLGTYVVAVNHQLKTEKDEPTLGLLVCKSKDDIKAQYALEASSQPLGVSAYELSKLIPENFKGSLPSIDEIESELRKDTEG